MTPDDFKLIDELFNRARRLPPDQRGDILDDAPSAHLRGEVESLLREHDSHSASFLDQPALGQALHLPPPAKVETPALPPLSRLGHYRIERQLGEGGMGIVYLAEQERTHRTCALKVIKPGYATQRMLSRFEHEARVLGRLKHPGIAQIYEADVVDGIPFIAMEYVQGTSLIEYARKHDLPLRDRLQLLARLCDAVSHAHLNGVIHRDLKPANILIDDANRSGSHTNGTTSADAAGQPKILDFGIARALDHDGYTTLRTLPGQLIGTIQYMSPEQALGDLDAIDARCDVYALGVIGYELLAGQLPYDLRHKPINTAVRIILEEDPIPLGTLDRSFRGDLSTIIGKTLEKEKERRYHSAAEFAEDIRRFLRDEPIAAHPPSTMYQLRKFARRNRSLVTASAVILAMLVVSVIVSSVFAIAELRQRRLAEQRFNDLHDLARAVIYEFDSQIVHVAGTLPARRLLVERGLTYLDRLATDADDNPTLQIELAGGYCKLGDVQGDPSTSNLGDFNGALESYAKGIQLVNAARRTDSVDDGLARQRLFDLNARRADVLRSMNRLDEALVAMEESLRLSIEIAAENRLVSTSRDVSVAHDRIAEVLKQLGRREDAQRHVELAATIVDRLAAENPDDISVQRDLAVRVFKQGLSLIQSDPEKALALFEEYVASARTLHEREPHNDVYLTDLATGLDRLGQTLLVVGRTDDAAAAHREGIEVTRRLMAVDPDDIKARHIGCMPHCRIGEIQLARGQMQEARISFQNYLDLAGDLTAHAPAIAAYQRDHGVALYKMYEWHATHGRDESLDAPSRREHWREARVWLERCREKFIEMRETELLSTDDTGVIDALATELEACDTELAKL